MPARPTPFSGNAPLVRYARLAFDEQHVLVPNNRIHSVEHTLDVALDRDGAEGADEIVIGGARWPAFALNRALEPVELVPEARSVCVLLDAAGGGLALLCDELRSLDEDTPRVVPVPACMRLARGPITSLCVVGEQVLGVVSVDGLLGWLRSRAAPPAAVPEADESAGRGRP